MATFHDIYLQYYARAYRFVKSYVRDAEASKDIVSEAMVALWHTYDESRETTLLPYLYKILRNRSLDYLKGERRKLQVLSTDDYQRGDLELRIQSLSDSPPDMIFSAEVQKILDETLAQMPSRTAEIFRLNRLEDKTYQEIADLYNISQKGVEYHMSKALRLLREALKDYLPLATILLLLS